MNPFWQKPQARASSGVRAVVEGNTAFALALYQALRTQAGNLFFSPYSISTALAMTYAGARGNTAAEMAQALHFRLEPESLHDAFAALAAQVSATGMKGHIQLRIANALWPHVSYPLLKSFLALVQRVYGARLTAVDYGKPEAARAIINAWIEERTESRIRELIPPGVLNALTTLVLVNAIYFKGNWAFPFDPDRSHDAPFWITPEAAVQAPLMAQKRAFSYSESEELQVLELPYAGEELSMVVLLPQKRDGLTDLEAALTVENLDRWTRLLRKQEVQVFLPRFEITFPFRLDSTLKSMGMSDAFTGAADFSGMDGTESLSIGAVLHKAFVVVNEEGTEAAAATAVAMARAAMPAPPPVFRADHPFIFLIREKHTGSLLFAGRVVHPL